MALEPFHDIGRYGSIGIGLLDTAFLLAHLLDSAGYEVRIVRSTLPDDAARTLVEQMLVPRAPAAAVGDDARRARLSLTNRRDPTKQRTEQEFHQVGRQHPFQNDCANPYDGLVICSKAIGRP